MGEYRFSLWSYCIGGAFKSIQLSFDIYRVSYHHLVHDIHQIIGWLHNLYKFQWTITSCLSYIKYWPQNIKKAWHLVLANVTFQYPAAPLWILQFTSICNDNVPLFGGGLPVDVHSILQAIHCNRYFRAAFSLSGCMFTGSYGSCVFINYGNRKCCAKLEIGE